MPDYTVTLNDDERNLIFTALSDVWIIQPRDAAEPSSADALFYKLNDLDTSPLDPHRERLEERITLLRDALADIRDHRATCPYDATEQPCVSALVGRAGMALDADTALDPKAEEQDPNEGADDAND